MINQVMVEAERRKALYEATGRGIRSLDIYNELTGSELPWVVMIVDEALYLMEKSKVVKENLEIAVSWAAKYGITAVIISQDFKANVISTATRNNFSSRFQFLAEDQTQANILVKGCQAHKIQQKGRCFARLPGNNTVTELQTPFVSEAQIMAIAPRIKSHAETISADTHPKPTPDERKILVAWWGIRNDPDFSGSKLYRKITGGDGRPNAKQLEKYRALLRKFGQNPNF
jgi:DNA segregation ATPase FtsK/SpoIIIE-like protein